MENQGLIPIINLVFDRHATIEQIHRIVKLIIDKRINIDVEADIAQRFFLMSRRLSTRSGIKGYFIKLKTAFQVIL
jgi:hypothetical protein